MNDHKRMPVSEFRERGYLQELNRQFLHPLGLALEIVTEEDGTERFGGVWDYRDDPEGIVFGDDAELAPHARTIEYELERRAPDRRDALGFVIQPVEPIE